jgi:hypothetical protein
MTTELYEGRRTYKSAPFDLPEYHPAPEPLVQSLVAACSGFPKDVVIAAAAALVASTAIDADDTDRAEIVHMMQVALSVGPLDGSI